MESTHNDQFKVAEFKNDSLTTTIYMVNPGEAFHGFGGSRHALQPKKTASMIVRTLSPMGLHDIEYDINDKAVWLSLMDVARATPTPAAATCPHCGRDNSAYGNVCTSDDCPGNESKALPVINAPKVMSIDEYRDMLTDLGIDADEPEEVIDPQDYYELYQTGSFSFYLGQHEKHRYFTMRLVIEEREKGE